jgi:hypothetical protein
MAAPTGKSTTPKRPAMVVLRSGAVAGSGSMGPPLLLELELELELLLLLLELLPEPLPPLPLPPQAASVRTRVVIATVRIESILVFLMTC